MPGFIFRRMPDTYRRQSAPGGVQIDKTRPRPEPGKKFKPRKPRGKCTLLRAGGAEQAPRGTGAYCVFPLPRTPTPGIYYRLEKRVIPRELCERSDASERKNDHRGRPRLCGHQNRPLCVPHGPHGIQPRTLHPAGCAGVRGKMVRVRDGPPAGTAGKDGERHLLPADAGSHRQGAGKAASAAQMCRGFGVRPAFDELRTAKGQL